MAQSQSNSTPTTTISSSLVSTVVPIPDLLTLPLELRSAILERVFPANPIQFYMNFSPNQDPPSAIHHSFHHLGILATNHQLRNEALSILRSAISSTTLTLNGVFPGPPPDYIAPENHHWAPEQERINQMHVYFSRLLNLFLTQYAPDIHNLEVININSHVDGVEVDFTPFTHLQHIIFAQYLFPHSPFPEMFPHGLLGTDAPFRIARRWASLRRVGIRTCRQITPCPAQKPYFEELLKNGVEKGFDVSISVRIRVNVDSPDLKWLQRSREERSGNFWLEASISPASFEVVLDDDDDDSPLRKWPDDGLTTWKGDPKPGFSGGITAATPTALS